MGRPLPCSGMEGRLLAEMTVAVLPVISYSYCSWGAAGDVATSRPSDSSSADEIVQARFPAREAVRPREAFTIPTWVKA
jgi:hypothetical protein